MVVALKYWTRKNITAVGYEREDTKIGGSGTYGTTVLNGRVVWPGDVQRIGLNIPTAKDAEPQLGNTWERKIIENGAEKPVIDITDYIVDEYDGYASLLGYVLGSDPTGAVSETKSTTTTNQGAITPQDLLGSFNMEVGYTDGSNEAAFLWKGCTINKLELVAEFEKPIERRCNIYAKSLDINNSFQSTGGTDTDALSPPSGRRAMWHDISFTWSGSISPELRRWSMAIDRALQWNHQLGTDKYTQQPIPTGYLVTGDFSILKEAGDSDMLNIAKATGTGGVAGTDYIDSLEVIINNGTAYIDAVLDDLMIVYNGTYTIEPGSDVMVESYSYNAVAQFSSIKVHS